MKKTKFLLILFVITAIALTGGCRKKQPRGAESAAKKTGTSSVSSDKTEKNTRATSIQCNKTKVILYLGKSEQLTVNFTPENAAEEITSWKSSDPNVAKVENGKITAVSIGSAVVTVKTASGLSAMVNVKVNERMATDISCTSQDDGYMTVYITFRYEMSEEDLKEAYNHTNLEKEYKNQIVEIKYRTSIAEMVGMSGITVKLKDDFKGKIVLNADKYGHWLASEKTIR